MNDDTIQTFDADEILRSLPLADFTGDAGEGEDADAFPVQAAFMTGLAGGKAPADPFCL